MDIATIAGIIAGFGLLIGTILTGEGAGAFLHLPSMLVVGGGATAATLVAFPMEQMISAFKVAAKTFLKQESTDTESVKQFIDLSQMARRDGILALDRALKDVPNPFMRSGLEMAVDGTEPETIRHIMETELSSRQERHQAGQGTLRPLGSHALQLWAVVAVVGAARMGA